MVTQSQLLTYDDYRTLPDDGNRYEIIGGELLMSPSPAMIHQLILGRLFALTNNYVEKNELGTMILAPADVVLSMRDVVQPDLMFISAARSDIIAENNVVEAPDLVVEILSETTAAPDRTSKKALYERNGVKEYWIVSPTEQTIEQFVLKDQTFASIGTFDTSESFSSSTIEGFTLQVGGAFPS